MKYSFFLKEPKGEKDTLILFSSYFKKEGKKFVYSTGENIKPSNWDKINKFPIQKGKDKSPDYESIKSQLNRYSDLFLQLVNRYKMANEVLTSKELKKAFDEEFKKAITGKNIFFDAYDLFMKEKTESKEWSPSTIKRYKNIKNHLQEFEKKKKFPLNFNAIDKTFYSEFTTYCLDDLEHINNTFLRNLGLFKTFMFWAIENKYTYNTTFKTFNSGKKNILKKVITEQIALSIDDLNKLMEKEFESKKLDKVRDVFVFACVTGMRFGELSLINKTNVQNDEIVLKEEKDTSKEARRIPLTNLSRYILLKYDYSLPLIANQKQNEYIKEVFQKMEYTHLVQRVTVKGKENVIKEIPFHDRISTHTARRTFITMMKDKGKSDKLIAKITGHKDMKTLNQYYQVEGKQKKEAMDEVFDIAIPMKKISG
jgi:site-specific recombinase XerD